MPVDSKSGAAAGCTLANHSLVYAVFRAAGPGHGKVGDFAGLRA